jgi:hypothetical protein
MLANQLEKMSSPTMARSCFFTRAQRWSSGGGEDDDVAAGGSFKSASLGACATAGRVSDIFNMELFPRK